MLPAVAVITKTSRLFRKVTPRSALPARWHSGLYDLIDLLTGVDAAYRESLKCGWMMRDTTLAFIAKMKDLAGASLNLVKYGSRAAGIATTLLGFPVETNLDMPAMGAGVKSILFGDFSTVVVRDVVGVTVYRMEDSAFVNKGQIGFLGVARSSAASTSNGAPIRAYQHLAS